MKNRRASVSAQKVWENYCRTMLPESTDPLELTEAVYLDSVVFGAPARRHGGRPIVARPVVSTFRKKVDAEILVKEIGDGPASFATICGPKYLTAAQARKLAAALLEAAGWLDAYRVMEE